MWKTILELLSRPATAWIEGRAARDYMRDEGHLAIKKAEVSLKIAQHEAHAARLQRMDAADSDYDLQAQIEKRYTLADELLTLCVIFLVGSHFFYPEALAAGWAAMGYSSAPWWLEFIIIGVFVSVFGLMRLFRAFNPFSKKEDKTPQGPT